MNAHFFIYARKSTDDRDRQVRSIDDQLAELRELARRESLHVIDVLVEKQTAKAPGRPVFNGMLERIERGEATGVLAWHPDRLARNSLDGGRLIYLVDSGKIQELRFPTFWFEATPQGKFMLAVAFGQSKYYVDNLSENIKRGQRQKLRQGIWPKMPPVGYLNDRVTRTIVPDPERAPLVQKAFELYATSEYTLDRLTETVNDLGLTGRNGLPLARSQYHRVLRNPIYCGIIRYNGELFGGKHEPLVSKGLFDAVQELVHARSQPKSSRLKPYLYRALFHCGECGRAVTTETQKGHNYLRCTKWKIACSQPYVREEAIGDQISAALRDVSLPADWADWMLSQADALQSQELRSIETRTQSIRDAITAADKKLDRLMAAYVEGALTLPEYRQAKNALIEAKRRLEEKLIAARESTCSPFEPLIRFIKATKQAAILAGSPDRASQRDFFKKVASNPTIEGRTIRITARGAWQLVAAHGPFAQNEKGAPMNGAPPEVAADHLAHMRRRWDSNPRDPCGPTGFQDRRIRPLCHSSGSSAECSRRAKGGQNGLSAGGAGAPQAEMCRSARATVVRWPP